MTDLVRRVALVTGGASGLGRAIAERLVAEGARVVISDIQAELAAAVAAELGADHLVQDVADEASWPTAIGRIRERHGGLHVLVNNAGRFDPVDGFDPEGMSFADWRRTLDVNLDSVFLGCRAAIPAIRDSGGGSIVNIASIAGSLATPYATAYGASKAAVLQLTRSVAQHCAERRNGVRCNAVSPGVVLTPQYLRHTEEQAARSGGAPDEEIARAERSIPLGEFVEPSEVAAIVAFLTSDASRHTTGSAFVVDGGILGCSTFTAG